VEAKAIVSQGPATGPRSHEISRAGSYSTSGGSPSLSSTASVFARHDSHQVELEFSSTDSLQPRTTHYANLASFSMKRKTASGTASIQSIPPFE
jgi:hypothetical protein